MKYIYFFLFLSLIACQSDKSDIPEIHNLNNAEDNGSKAETGPKGTAEFNLEEQPYSFKNLKEEKISAIFESNRMIFHFEDNDVPVNIELSIHDMSVLENGSRIFTIPEDNVEKMLVDLTFTDYQRIGKMSMKQIKFKEGTIDIKSISKNAINFSFNGKAGPVVNDAAFPVNGELNFTFPNQ